MNCESFEGLMAGLLAGDATREERETVEAHLLDCAACRDVFATAKQGWEGAKLVRVAGLPDEVDRRVREALKPKSAWERFFRVGTGIAAGIMIAVALFRAMPAGPTKKETPPPAAFAMVAPARIGTLYAVDPDTQQPVGELSIQSLSVNVEILDGVAQTTVEQTFFNETDARLEGQFRFPLPSDASITRLAMEIDGKLMEGEVVERQKARQTYEGIVRSMKDPALLEWMPGGMFSCRIFPIEAKQPKRIVIGYQQALAGFDGKMQYVYPLVSETTSTREIGLFTFNAVAKGAKLAGKTSMTEAKFRAKQDVVVEVEVEAAEASLVSHREGEWAHFNLFVQPKADAMEQARARTSTIYLVDNSAAMNEPTMDVVRRVVSKLVGATDQVFGFNLTGDLSEATKQSALDKLFALKPNGALDLAKAVRLSMAACPDGGEVVFVGGGTPSWGETDAAKIVAGAKEACGTKQVTFRAVAVGSGADRVTLTAVASAFSGGVQAISPSDDVNARIAQIALTAGRAAMSDVKVQFEGQTADIAPAQLGSVYFGERVLVAGRCTGTSVKAVLTGKVQGRDVRREWTFAVPAEEKGNLFVRRLWAQRRLVDLMAKGAAAQDEITKLGVAERLMTPFTSFLVLESEKAYEDHAIERAKKAEERLVKGEPVTDPEKRKKEVLTKMSHLLDLAYMSFDQKKLDKTIQICNEILVIDPRYTVALELKEDAEKSRHREEYYEFLKKKVENWKSLSDSNDHAVIPNADTVRIPSAAEWREITGRVTQRVIKTQDALDAENVQPRLLDQGGLELGYQWLDGFETRMLPYDTVTGKYRSDPRSFRLPLAGGSGGSGTLANQFGGLEFTIAPGDIGGFRAPGGSWGSLPDRRYPGRSTVGFRTETGPVQSFPGVDVEVASNYWVGSVYGLNGIAPNSGGTDYAGNMVRLVEPSMASADGNWGYLPDFGIQMATAGVWRDARPDIFGVAINLAGPIGAPVTNGTVFIPVDKFGRIIQGPRSGIMPGFERFTISGGGGGGANATIDLPRISDIPIMGELFRRNGESGWFDRWGNFRPGIDLPSFGASMIDEDRLKGKPFNPFAPDARVGQVIVSNTKKLLWDVDVYRRQLEVAQAQLRDLIERVRGDEDLRGTTEPMSQLLRRIGQLLDVLRSPEVAQRAHVPHLQTKLDEVDVAIRRGLAEFDTHLREIEVGLKANRAVDVWNAIARANDSSDAAVKKIQELWDFCHSLLAERSDTEIFAYWQRVGMYRARLPQIWAPYLAQVAALSADYQEAKDVQDRTSPASPVYAEVLGRVERAREAHLRANAGTANAFQELQHEEQEFRRLTFILVMRGLLTDGLDVTPSGLGAQGRITGVEFSGVNLGGFAAGDFVAITRGKLLIAVVRINSEGRGDWTSCTYGFPQATDSAHKIVDEAALTKSISLRFERDAVDTKNDATLRLLLILKERP